MLLTIHDSLVLAAPYVPANLVSVAAWDRMGRIASILPASTILGTFESRLDGNEQVDYQICFTASSGGRNALATWLASFGDEIDPSWRQSIEFLRSWSTPGTVLYENSPAAWFEFDCCLDDPEPPSPFPFFSLHPPWEDKYIPGPQRLAAAEIGFSSLAGSELDTALRDQIREALSTLPRSGCLIHAALRPVGQRHVARLIVRLPVDQIEPYLTRLRWPGATLALRAFLQEYCISTRVHSLQLDVTGAGLGPRLGIEFFYASAPVADQRWQGVLDRLVADGACTAERRRQVEAWVGTTSTTAFEWILRGLLVKVVFAVDRIAEAKAYLPFCVNPALDLLPDARGVNRSPSVGPGDAQSAHFFRGVVD